MKQNTKNENMNPSRELSPNVYEKRRNRVGAALFFAALLAGGLVHEVTPDSANKSEAPVATADIKEAVKNGAYIDNSVIIFRDGVRFRDSPKMTQTPEGKPSNENVARVNDTITVVVNPLIEGDYYTVPDSGHLRYVNSDVVGQISSDTGAKFGEVAYLDQSEADAAKSTRIIRKGKMIVEDGSGVYMRSEEGTVPVSEVHTFESEAELQEFLAAETGSIS